MRIIAGIHKGRKIELAVKSAKPAHVRPTSGFTREAIFNILSHGDHAGILDKARVADIFCGTGALGLEALSRGAAHATFVDMEHAVLLSARANAERMGEAERIALVRANATQLPPAREPFNVVFIDPPYFSKLIPPCLASLRRGNWVDAQSLLIIEHDIREEVSLPAEFQEVDARHYGRAAIRLLRL